MNEYFYLDSQGKQHGPISVDSFKMYDVTANTMVWCVSMDDWKKAKEVEELKHLFTNEPPEPPKQDFADDIRRDFESAKRTFSNPLAGCPETHMVGAILATLASVVFGFSILGTIAGGIAIYKADQVKTYYRLGHYDNAELMSYDAKRWVKYSIVMLIITRLIWFVIVVIAILALHFSLYSFYHCRL